MFVWYECTTCRRNYAVCTCGLIDLAQMGPPGVLVSFTLLRHERSRPSTPPNRKQPCPVHSSYKLSPYRGFRAKAWFNSFSLTLPAVMSLLTDQEAPQEAAPGIQFGTVGQDTPALVAPVVPTSWDKDASSPASGERFTPVQV